MKTSTYLISFSFAQSVNAVVRFKRDDVEVSADPVFTASRRETRRMATSWVFEIAGVVTSLDESLVSEISFDTLEKASESWISATISDWMMTSNT